MPGQYRLVNAPKEIRRTHRTHPNSSNFLAQTSMARDREAERLRLPSCRRRWSSYERALRVRRASSSVEDALLIGFSRFAFGGVVLFSKSVLPRQRKLLAILLMAFIPSPNRAMASRWRSNSP